MDDDLYRLLVQSSDKKPNQGLETVKEDLLPALLDSAKSTTRNQAVWKVFTKIKDVVPHGSRLENLTWRLMHLKLPPKGALSDLNPKMKQERHSIEIDHFPTPTLPSTPHPEVEVALKCETENRCSNCKTSKTSVWRRHKVDQSVLCNACALFYQKNHRMRPPEMKTDIVRRRNRKKDSKFVDSDEEEEKIIELNEDDLLKRLAEQERMIKQQKDMIAKQRKKLQQQKQRCATSPATSPVAFGPEARLIPDIPRSVTPPMLPPALFERSMYTDGWTDWSYFAPQFDSMLGDMQNSYWHPQLVKQEYETSSCDYHLKWEPKGGTSSLKRSKKY